MICLICQPLIAAENVGYLHWDFLKNRAHSWPNWQVPTNLPSSELKEDLLYPYWFRGLWSVESVELENSNKRSIHHLAYFKTDANQNIVPDRIFNSTAIGKAVFGKEFLEVKDFPKSPNLQLVFLVDGSFLETRVIGRKQAFDDQGTYIYDELLLEIFHSSGVSRINKVETLGRFMPCDKSIKSYFDSEKMDICAEQFQARYNLSDDKVSIAPDSFHHYSLRLMPVPENAAINIPQDYLSN